MDKPPFRELLRRAMEQAGVSQRELARRSGKNISTISFTLQGKTWGDKYPPLDDINAYARALEVDPALLRGDDLSLMGPMPQRPVFLGMPMRDLLKRMGAEKVRDIEFDMKAAAGPQRRSPQSERVRPRKPHYVIEVEGDCMVPEINNGDVVHFDPDLDPENGDWVVATVDGNNAIVKKLVVKDGVMQRLMPLNGEPLVIDENVRIVGVVISYERPGPRGRRR